MRSLRLLPLGIALFLSVWAGPAQASPRSEATRLIAMEQGIAKKLAPLVMSRAEEVTARMDSCLPEDAPEELTEEMALRRTSLMFRNIYEAFTADIHRYNRRLQRLSGRNAVVRRTSRSIVVINGYLAQLGDAAPDPCLYFDAWRAAGWTADFRADPAVDTYSPEEIADFRRALRMVVAGARSFRRLGVPRNAARGLERSYRAMEFYVDLPAL